MKHATGLDTLLSSNGYKYVYPNPCWYKIEARSVKPTVKRPHGIRYDLTFHDARGKRIFGMDNKHVPKNLRKGYHGRIVKFDHVHNNPTDMGAAYNFVDAETLIIDFFKRVESMLKKMMHRNEHGNTQDWHYAQR